MELKFERRGSTGCVNYWGADVHTGEIQVHVDSHLPDVEHIGMPVTIQLAWEDGHIAISTEVAWDDIKRKAVNEYENPNAPCEWWEPVSYNVLTHLIAACFRHKIACELSPGVRAIIDLLNEAEEHVGICHSHDYCDANVVMRDAFMMLYRDIDINDDMHIAVWGGAWTLAMQKGFSPGFEFTLKENMCVHDRYRSILFNAIVQLKEGYLDTGLCTKGTYAHDIFIDVYNVFGWLTEDQDDHPDGLDLAESCLRMDRATS